MFQIFSYIGHNLQSVVEHGGYLLIFLTTILEGFPVIGQFVPGHTIVVISGFLSRIEVLNIYKVLPIVMFSAILGDFLGYRLGKKFGIELLYKFGSFFFIKPEYVDKARTLVQDNTAKTILFGRFSPMTRSLTPFIVGAIGVNHKKFWIFDTIGAILWAISSILIGYIFGASYNAISTMFGRYIVIAMILGVLIAWGYRLINRQFHIFAKYELIILFVNLFGLYLFFKTVQDALSDKIFLLELDLFTNSYFLVNAKEPWLTVMNVITNVLSPGYITLIGLIGLAIFFHYRKYTYSIITALSLGGGYIFTFVIKNIVMRARPENAFILQGGYSFPSGHAVAATIFFTLIIYIFVTKIQSIVLREVLIVASVFTALLVAFSRVYLGVHWLSDVLAGIGLGLFWTTSIILFIRYIRLIMFTIRSRRE
jgi:undecaprenyl-diphosphatase